MFLRKITTNLRRTSIEQPTSIKRPLASTSRVRTQLIKLTAHDLHLHVNISEELLSLPHSFKISSIAIVDIITNNNAISIAIIIIILIIMSTITITILSLTTAPPPPSPSPPPMVNAIGCLIMSFTATVNSSLSTAFKCN